MDFKTLPIDPEMAEVIMGALAVAYSEGISGIIGNENANYTEAEERLVRCLYSVYPEIVSKYDWLDSVIKITKDKWDEKWKVWKEKHFEVLRESKVNDEYIEHDMNRLFKMLEEYTPTTFKRTKCTTTTT